MMPERLAVVKLRGFIEDMQAKPVESEPGLIRVQLDMPQGWKEPNERAQSTSAILGWLSNNRAPTSNLGESRSRSNCAWQSSTQSRHGRSWHFDR